MNSNNGGVKPMTDQDWEQFDNTMNTAFGQINEYEGPLPQYLSAIGYGGMGGYGGMAPNSPQQGAPQGGGGGQAEQRGGQNQYQFRYY
ncbi:hypothetical protein VTO42DRAFT_727 [Malbranchea cinnamomea]